jgi:hypothetical protein
VPKLTGGPWAGWRCQHSVRRTREAALSDDSTRLGARADLTAYFGATTRAVGTRALVGDPAFVAVTAVIVAQAEPDASTSDLSAAIQSALLTRLGAGSV